MTTIQEVNDRLKAMRDRAPAAATAAVMAMGLDFTAEVRSDELSRRSHPAGTPTNSPPGNPPSLISGALRGSVYPDPPITRGFRSSIKVGGRTVYARIQELGGWAGRNHASHLPPRPYLSPAAGRVLATGQARKAAVRGWLTVMR